MKTTSIIIKASRSLCGTGVLALILSASTVQASVSISGNYVGATAPTINNTFGTLEFALNMGGSALTRDGIAFTAAGTTPAGATRNFLTSGGVGANINVVGVSQGGTQTWGTASLSGADPLFYTIAFAQGSVGYEITVTGLDAAKSYQFQFLFGDPRTTFPYSNTVTVFDSSSNTATATLGYGSSSPTDQFAMLTAVVSGSTSFKFRSFRGASGGGPGISGLVVHSSTVSVSSTSDSRTIAEDTQVLLATDDFGTYSDPNSVPLAAVKISTLASAGSLEYDTTGAGAWAAVTVDQEISAAHIIAGRLRFTPVADGNGTPYATVGFRVGNGTEFSIPYTLTVNVTPINDYAPTAANQVLGIAQGGNKVLTAANFGFADADGNDTLQKVKVTQLPTAGSLTLSSVAVTLDQEITVADINAGNLRFTPEPTASGLAYATFDFNVSDGTFYSPTSATMTIDIVALSVVQSVSPIPFANSGTLVGAAVFGNAGTYDGIPFALWSPPFTSAVAFGSGVTAVANAPFSNIDANLGGVAGGQYRTANYSSGNAPGRLTVSGLDSAQTYRFQIGFGDLRVGSYPYSVNASITLSNASAVTVPLAIGAVTTADDYALLTVTVTGTTSIRLDLPTAANGVGPIIAGFAVHRLGTSPYDTWASANGASSDPAEDSNHNGVPNGVEYFMGATPGNPATLPALVDTAGTWSWTIPYDPAAAASYKFQSSDALSSWADALPGEIQILTSPDRIQFTLPSGTGRKFCRLEVTPTP